MDVDTVMNLQKSITLMMVMMIATGGCQSVRGDASSSSEPLIIGSVRMTIERNGSLSALGRVKGNPTIEIGLPFPETCDFVRWPYTNVIHIERYWDAWVALIQCHRKVDTKEPDPRFGCDTKYKALVVRDDGEVFLNPNPKGGSGCPPILRDRLAFTYLADPYVHKDLPK
jgi:hypothetical protein